MCGHASSGQQWRVHCFPERHGGRRWDSGHLCVPGSPLPRERVWRGKVACIQPEGSHRAGLALTPPCVHPDSTGQMVPWSMWQ